ncbi:TadE/TadG family type IV pilus assembly protein [Sphingopyxis terrae]|uniref:TadE/TadG family type IV pilus assembly protein n=1 Tax=Sphingopyxis terrae TaxID=33052 RepID=UPI003F7E16CA
MTGPYPPNIARRPTVIREVLHLARNERAAAIVEMALVLPLFLTLLIGILIYGQYFLLAHNVQQAANDGARAAIVGVDAADRRAVAIRAVDRSMASIGDYSPANRSIAVSETSEAVTRTSSHA